MTHRAIRNFHLDVTGLVHALALTVDSLPVDLKALVIGELSDNLC